MSPPVDPNLAAGDLYPAAAIGHSGQPDGGFARAGFPDEPQHLAGLQIKVDAVHDLDINRLFSGRIGGRADFQAAYLEKWLGHPRPPFSDVVRFKIQSATRLIEMQSVAMA